MPRATAPRPFPFAPIAEAMERGEITDGDLGWLAAYGQVQTLGSCRQRVQRWKTTGLTIWEADRVATALGTHARVVWPDEWDALCLEDEDEFTDDDDETDATNVIRLADRDPRPSHPSLEVH